MYSRRQIVWRGDSLYLKSGRKLFSIVVDAKNPLMWRIRYPDGRLSDMASRPRTVEAAEAIALQNLNGQETASEVPPMRSAAEGIICP